MDSVFQYVACTCWICCLTSFGGIFTGVGIFLLSRSAGQDFREAECDVLNSSATANVECEFRVNTSLTGATIWTKTGRCAVTTEECDACTEFGDCWVMYDSDAEDAKPVGVSRVGTEIFGTGLGLVMTAMGSLGFAVCCLSCFGMRIIYIAVSHSDPEIYTSSRLEPEPIGDDSEVGLRQAALAKGHVRRLKGTVRVFTQTLCWVIVAMASMAVMLGAYLGFVMLYLHNRGLEIAGVKLPAEAAWAGFGMSIVFVVLVPLLWCAFGRAQRKAERFIDQFSGGEGGVQQSLARAVIDKLNSPSSAKYKQLLLDYGIGDDALNRILTAPPDRMVLVLLESLSGIVLAKILTDMFDSTITTQFDEIMIMYTMGIVGLPTVFVCSLMWLAHYCISFAASPVCSIIEVFLLGSVLSYRLGMGWIFPISCTVLGIALMISLFISWGMNGASGLSIVCFLFSLPAYVVWFGVCFVFLAGLQPMLQAMFEVIKEHGIVAIWRICECERDPKELRAKEEHLNQRVRCVDRIVGEKRRHAAIRSFAFLAHLMIA
eukprot:TRINITY_DN10960_c0_g1_i4.p1 TRINITY_DN10960_c0_g1~~TRINITY_DN10960_c0_g1_i4.p1  ORF type:complete len:544 (+),score=84.14 TRINITY_DN10960_c0_g1_i4:242-1873(+)